MRISLRWLRGRHGFRLVQVKEALRPVSGLFVLPTRGFCSRGYRWTREGLVPSLFGACALRESCCVLWLVGEEADPLSSLGFLLLYRKGVAGVTVGIE